MQISERWLRSFVDPSLSTGELTHLLTMSGLEVEACAPVAFPFCGVVVAEVMEVRTHLNADRLNVCLVRVGQNEALSIVCGAPNVAKGMRVPCALPGAELPGMQIKATTIRGEESKGMLCSARELGLSQDHSGLLALPPDAPVGEDIRAYLALDDNLITIKLTPNRADCLSVLGIAREVAALTGSPLRLPDSTPVPLSGEAMIRFGISDSRGCGRFSGRVISNVDARAPTPDWMKRRLERAGQRPIAVLVDVTNYVMLELGRPLHVYDIEKLNGCIDVRAGRKGERIKLLNEQTVEVDESVVCITDASGPIGLAGIMGGDGTKADLDTHHVFLESAFFFPHAIAGRARRFNFSSDASYRFERGVDFDNNVAGLERATRLILDICGGKAGPVTDIVAGLPQRRPVRMRVSRAHKVIGVSVPPEEIQSIFTRLGFPFVREGAGDSEAFIVTPPSFRFDIEIEEDLIEEIARVYGFDRIPENPPLAESAMRAQPESRLATSRIRDQLVDGGFDEVVNFSFVDELWEVDFAGISDPIRLLNPIAAQLAVMRSTLIGSLVSNVRYNLNRNIGRVRAFEIARVFRRDDAIKEGEMHVSGIDQRLRVGAIACGPAFEEQWGIPSRSVDFFDLKGDVEALLSPQTAVFSAFFHPALHPGKAASVALDGRVIGWVGELHPRWRRKYQIPCAAVLFELDLGALCTVGVPTYHDVSKFPPMIRDIAVVVDESITVQSLHDAIISLRLEAVQQVYLFDVYRGRGVENGRKSLAFRVVIQDTAKTLTDSEADAAMANLTAALTSRFGARLRT